MKVIITFMFEEKSDRSSQVFLVCFAVQFINFYDVKELNTQPYYNQKNIILTKWTDSYYNFKKLKIIKSN